jgi:membrane-associated HD superfamily phosphohydrolase
MKKVFYITSAVWLSVLSFGSSVQAAINPDLPAVGTGGACSTFATQGLSGVFNCLTGIMNQVVVLLIAGAVVYIVYGAFTMIRSEEKRESGREMVVYGIIGLFVMISVWGLVNILDRTFNLRGSYIPAPQITPQ